MGERDVFVGPARQRGACFALAALAPLLVLLWQSATIRYNRDRNWTALYCTGLVLRVPPSLQHEEIYRFPGTGFDGQYYHYIAHDPLFRQGLSAYIDDPRLRYRRILVPALAFLAAIGRPEWVDVAYLAVILASVSLGVYWVARLAVGHGRPAVWGLSFLLLPAVVVSVDRLTADVLLLALCAGFAVFAPSRPGWRLALILALACLVRETGFLLLIAACIWSMLQGLTRRALLLSAAALPTVAWFFYVQLHTEGQPYPASFVPMRGIVAAFMNPMPYADKHPLIAGLDQAGDAIALTGLVLALGLALRLLRRRSLSPAEIACVLFAVLGIFLQRTDHWQHVFDFGRVYSPLLLFLALNSLRSGRWLNLLPVALMYPRIGLQLGSQIVGVVWGIINEFGA